MTDPAPYFLKAKSAIFGQMLALLRGRGSKQDWLDLHAKHRALVAKCNMLTGHLLGNASTTAKCFYCGYQPCDPNGSCASRKYSDLTGEDLISH